MTQTPPRFAAFVRPAATDRELLHAFLAERCEAAFAELVRRHGPLVLGVCRRVLGNSHDADDAFQTAFLVLARKAGDIAKPDGVATWLYSVAYRTARELRHMRDRRRTIEARAPAGRDPAPPDHDLAAVLDDALARLPEWYRTPIVLCELQGLSRKQAAAKLGIPEGTLSSRLAMAKKRLADQLTRRGVTATVAAVSGVLAREATARVPGPLVAAAVQAVAETASPVVLRAAEGVIKAMFVTKLKGLGVAVCMVVMGVGSLGLMPGAAGDGPKAVAPSADVAKLVEQLGSDKFDDREAAEKKLVALGAAALPAVTAGKSSTDPEVARRCATIAQSIRKTIRAELVKRFDPAKTDDYDHPVWKHYKAVAGDTPASRKLFAELIADPARLQVLDEADDDPQKAAEHYAAEVIRAGTVDLANWNGGNNPPSKLVDMTLCLVLGTYDATGKQAPALVGTRATGERFAFLNAEFYRQGLERKSGAENDLAVPLRRLYAAWLDRRTDPRVLEIGFDRAITWQVDGALPTARRLLADANAAPSVRMNALTFIGKYGTPDDDSAVNKLADDTTVFHSVVVYGVTCQTQVRDLAVAVRLKLAKQDPERFGFRTYTGHPFDWAQQPVTVNCAYPWGFPTDDARDTAHKKANEFLDKQAKKPGR